MLVLNIVKFLAFRRQALTLIGHLSKKYASFVKADMAMFEMLEKEKKENHVGSDQEYSEFLQECCSQAGTTKDFNIELYLRVGYLPRLLAHCTQVRIKDLYIIFDTPAATAQALGSIEQALPQGRVLQNLRKLEFTRSPSQQAHEFQIAHSLLSQTTRNLNRIRIDHL